MLQICHNFYIHKKIIFYIYFVVYLHSIISLHKQNNTLLLQMPQPTNAFSESEN